MCDNNCNQGCGCNEESLPCECTEKDVATDCILYTGDDLECSGVEKGTILTEVISQLDAFICQKFIEVLAYFNVVNIGLGAKVFKSISSTGAKELRTIVSESDEIAIIENEDTIGISVDLSDYSTIGYVDMNINTLETTLTTYVDNTNTNSTATTTNEISTVEADLTTYIDSSVNGLASESYVTQSIIDAQVPETVTTLQDEGNGTYTYINENSVQTVINTNTDLTGLASETYVNTSISNIIIPTNTSDLTNDGDGTLPFLTEETSIIAKGKVLFGDIGGASGTLVVSGDIISATATDSGNESDILIEFSNPNNYNYTPFIQLEDRDNIESDGNNDLRTPYIYSKTSTTFIWNVEDPVGSGQDLSLAVIIFKL